jgi:transposase InsO family protein
MWIGIIFVHRVSERRACAVLSVRRSVHRYRSIRGDQAFLVKRIKEIAFIRVRYGYHRVHILLRREGWPVNHSPYALFADHFRPCPANLLRSFWAMSEMMYAKTA